MTTQTQTYTASRYHDEAIRYGVYASTAGVELNSRRKHETAEYLAALATLRLYGPEIAFEHALRLQVQSLEETQRLLGHALGDFEREAVNSALNALGGLHRRVIGELRNRISETYGVDYAPTA